MKLEEVVRSVHRFTRDVIVITEAEPIDEPGPKIVFVNDAFELETGYSRQEVIGKTWSAPTEWSGFSVSA